MASLFCPPTPALPRFSTLLVKGPYPPSSPFHLCVSHLKSSPHQPHERALFLTPNREAISVALEDFNDGWMAEHCMAGAYATLFSRIDMFYPPTPKHWLCLLSLFRPLECSSANTPPSIAMLPHGPSLIVLHEPSSYFLSNTSSDNQPGDLAQYLQLIIGALSLSSFLARPGESIPIVLFDSRIDDLKLPIVRSVSPSRRLNSEEDTHPSRQEHVVRFIEKYFEWIGNVTGLKDDESFPSTPPLYGSFDAGRRRTGLYKLKLQNRLKEDPSSISWEWTESKKSRRSNAGRLETRLDLQLIPH